MTKRKLLIDAGLPEASPRIGVVTASSLNTHAVLTVVTDKGDFVVDPSAPGHHHVGQKRISVD